MSIPVQCPACQHAFAVAEKFVGKKGKCPKCGAIFRAGSPAEDAVGVFPEVPPAAAVPSASMPARSRVSHAPSPAPLNAGLSDSGPVSTFPTVPRGIPIPTPVTPAFAVAPSGHEPHRGARRSKNNSLPLVIGGSVAGLALLGIALGVAWSLGGNSGGAVAKKPATKAAESTEASAAPTTATVVPPVIQPSLDIAALTPFQDSVFALDIKSPQGMTKGACFLVADRGYAVTPAHLVSQATSVEAVTADGIRIAVSGIAAIDEAHDVAIIKLEPTLPIPLEALAFLTIDAANNSDLAVIDAPGKPARVMPGKYKSADAFAKLSPSMRAKLKNHFSEWADDSSIVLHSIHLDATCHGAPLVTQQGQVVAMQIAPDGNNGLALHVKHIASLIGNIRSEVKPFGAPVVATNDPAPLPAVDPVPPLTPLPTPKPAADDPIDELLARIKEHRDECEKKDWTAKDATDYAQFQLLARFVNEAATGADTPDVPPEVKEKLEAGVREALYSLTAEKWPSDDAWKQTNEQAMKGLETAGQGVFALATVIVPTSQGNMLGDVPIAVVEITGQSQMLVLPLASGGEKFGVGQQLLVLGMHDPTTLIKFKNIDVPLVRTKYVLAVQKQD